MTNLVSGEVRLVRRQAPANQGLVEWLLACPEKGFFVPIASEFSARGEGGRDLGAERVNENETAGWGIHCSADSVITAFSAGSDRVTWQCGIEMC